MAETKLNWAAATVKQGKLTVPLDGDVAKGWKGHFETTVKLLGRGEWGNVELKKKSVRVAGVESGSEDNLRFYLEGVVEQVNSAVAADEQRESKADSPEHDPDSEPGDDGPDGQLTERFRSFADQRTGDPESSESSESERA